MMPFMYEVICFDLDDTLFKEMDYLKSAYHEIAIYATNIAKGRGVDFVSEEKAHDCNCQRNSNSRDNEPCCGCDSKQTNADRIRNMSDEELAELLFNKSRCDNCFANCNDKDNCPSLSSCYSRHLEWLQSEAE